VAARRLRLGGDLARHRGIRGRQVDEDLAVVRGAQQPAVAQDGPDLRRAGHNEQHRLQRGERAGLRARDSG
jgi:hypothetical protein